MPMIDNEADDRQHKHGKVLHNIHHADMPAGPAHKQHGQAGRAPNQGYYGTQTGSNDGKTPPAAHNLHLTLLALVSLMEAIAKPTATARLTAKTQA